jgi:hypothetical protein
MRRNALLPIAAILLNSLSSAHSLYDNSAKQPAPDNFKMFQIDMRHFGEQVIRSGW